MMHVMEPSRSHATLLTSSGGQGQNSSASTSSSSASGATHDQSIVPAPAGFKDDESSEASHSNNALVTSESSAASEGAQGQSGEQQEAGPEVDIVINNVVCSFSVRCHLNLRDIALRGVNVEYRRENGMVTMKIRRPYTTASIWSSGKITCTGANSEEHARIAARRYARLLYKLGFQVKFRNFRVVNVLGSCNLPFAIKITQFSQKYKEASYEPELHPGVTFKMKQPKATLKIFSTGSITVTAPRVQNVQEAIEKIFYMVYEFQKPKSAYEEEKMAAKEKKSQLAQAKARKRKHDDESRYHRQHLEEMRKEQDIDDPELSGTDS